MKKRYNVMLNPATLAKVDYFARENGLSRSEAINRILYDFCRTYNIVVSVPVLEGQIEVEEIDKVGA